MDRLPDIRQSTLRSSASGLGVKTAWCSLPRRVQASLRAGLGRGISIRAGESRGRRCMTEASVCPTGSARRYQAGRVGNDRHMSVGRDVACSSCHMPYTGFTTPIPSINLGPVAMPGSMRRSTDYPRSLYLDIVLAVVHRRHERGSRPPVPRRNLRLALSTFRVS